MPQQIQEKDGVHKDWYSEARDMKAETLPAFIAKLTQDYAHDYGTICHAIAAAAIGAAWAVEHSPQGGITGFQAGAVMWEFVSHWMSYEGKPMRLTKYDEMLYPQYEADFQTISKETHSYLIEQAKKNLTDRSEASTNVITHWQRVAAGEVPFGYRVEG